ncbi:acetyltransferase GNAT family protein [Indivirus ILV1]|uniref:Acetyltransferase GNAT family protein n=1 Tax=Indivirus ILV1 TaxID=1977633 RepID=A0A1V0SCL3_9VIRU|nr:acetyltransferase GNAT family protein [Indivirus ILV1]
MNITCIKTTRIKNPELLAQLIYYNFNYLVKYPELQHTQKDIMNALLANGNLCYLLFHNNKLIGYMVGDFRTLPDNRYGYYISYVFISEKYRNGGLGTKLMNMLIKECQNRGVSWIVLTCDTRDKKIVKFYKKYGFNIDSGLNGNNVIHKVFSLRLN